jgi:hypothetical protein
MPAKSEAQRAWAFGAMGPEWAKKHHYDNPGKLPAKAVKESKSDRMKRKIRERMARP